MKAEYSANFLVGPTAVGKTAVAQWIAERTNANILSADSMLVYRHMDIGTAKPGVLERGQVVYFGIDVVAPDSLFSAGRYLEEADMALAVSREQGRSVLVVGGTGLYIKALTHGLAEGPAVSNAGRGRWEAVLAKEGVEGLQAALRAVAPGLLESLPDARNARRVMRALEMAEAGVRRRPASWADSGAGGTLVGLRRAADDLAAAIELRTEQMFNSGLSEEAARLQTSYPELSRTALQAIGYAEAIACVAGTLDLAEAKRCVAARTRRLAKRQMTWFNHQAKVDWVDVECGMGVEEIAEQVLGRWREHGPTRIAI